jgi:hypothetical protein
VGEAHAGALKEALMTIETKIPAMTDQEVATLYANAERISKGAASKQQAEAERLLPIIAEALDERRKLRAVELADKKVVRQKAMAEARAKRTNAKKQAAAEAQQ